MSKLIVEENYHYTECGLDNVLIKRVEVKINDVGDKVLMLGNVKAFDAAIALAICTKPYRLNAVEIRFLRKHLRLTQVKLGELLHKSRVTVNRWESELLDIDPNAETIIRLFTLEAIGKSKLFDMSILKVPSLEEISKFPVCLPEDNFEIIMD